MMKKFTITRVVTKEYFQNRKDKKELKKYKK